MNSIPVVGMLIVPKHKPGSFCTILEVEKLDTEYFTVKYLRHKDSLKIDSVPFRDAETFWTYYEER